MFLRGESVFAPSPPTGAGLGRLPALSLVLFLLLLALLPLLAAAWPSQSLALSRQLLPLGISGLRGRARRASPAGSAGAASGLGFG